MATQVVLGLALVLAYARAGSDTGLPGTIVALVLVGAAAAIGLWALVTLRPSFRVAPTPRRGGVLITHGVYRRLRHPMYNSVLLIVAAMAIHRPDLAVIGVAAANLAFYTGKARYEEGLLLARYPGYRDYRKRTIGVLPGL